MGYFYWLRFENSDHLHTELGLGYLEDEKFCLESKASFIDISSIASFKLILIASLWEYCTFSDSSRNTGQQINCFDRCQLIIIWISNIREVHGKPRRHDSVNLLFVVRPPCCGTPLSSSPS